VFARHGGREIEAVGDGFFVEFPSALAGASVPSRSSALHDRNGSFHGRRIEVRIGLHLGDVVAQDDRVHGDGVNIAARIERWPRPAASVSRRTARQTEQDRGAAAHARGEPQEQSGSEFDVLFDWCAWERKRFRAERAGFQWCARADARTLIGAGVPASPGGWGGWAWRRGQTQTARSTDASPCCRSLSMKCKRRRRVLRRWMTEERFSRFHESWLE